jgi:triacylglycerol lipase
MVIFWKTVIHDFYPDRCRGFCMKLCRIPIGQGIRLWAGLRFGFLTASTLLFISIPAGADCIVLLHGLARTSASMEALESGLLDSGYDVVNVDYPSRHHTIQELAPLAMSRGIDHCPDDGLIHFVTHSLGGILVRFYLEQNEISRLGRLVMLAPPNQGSEVVDNLRGVPGFELYNGPAGVQLGTGSDSIPLSLKPPDYDIGVIAGTKTFNPILSQFLPNPDDGKVSVESTKLDGMKDFITVPYSHPFIAKAPEVLEQSISFLETGFFIHPLP